MRSPTRFVAGAAAGVFAIGAAAGWIAPAIFKNAQAADTAGASAPAAMVPSGPIPLGTAPNYHAIVVQNRGSVVGITVAGELKAAAEQQQPFNPFGDDDNNPFSQFFRQMPHQHGNPADACPGLRFHRELRRSDLDQRARRRRCERGHGQADGSSRVQGQGARHG